MEFEIVLESFERWFKGAQLTTDDTTNIVMGIILVVLLIVLIVMLVIISIQTLFWTRIGWFFEDVWHWLKRRRFVRRLTCPPYCSLIPGSYFDKEDLTDEEIHEIMNIIHHGNPPKYKIVRGEDMNKENLEQESNDNPINIKSNAEDFSNNDGLRADDRSTGTSRDC